MIKEFQKFIEEEHPDVSFKNKGDDAPWLHALILWLGATFVKEFDTRFTTTIGTTIYFPKGWRTDFSSYKTYKVARHEMIHVIDYKRFGLWFLISYAILLPAIFTMRAFWEIRGYTQSILVDYEYYGDIDRDKCFNFMESTFCGASYFWMLPFRGLVRRKFSKIIDDIESGEISGFYPYGDP